MHRFKFSVELEIVSDGDYYEAREDLYDMLPSAGTEQGVSMLNKITMNG